MPPIRRKSHEIYDRLLRGEATSAEYVAALRHEAALRIAEGRRRRMIDGRPTFELSDDELRASTETAMRLAKGGR